MACPLVSLRTQMLYTAQTGGTWTYNGYSSTFDGNEDNLAQFVGVPLSPPEELLVPLVGDDPTFDPTGHTVGYYSLSYTIIDAGCSAVNNIVIPLVETYYGGVDVTQNVCFSWLDGTTCVNEHYDSVFNLFDLISDYGNEVDVDTGGTWVQIAGTPNPHPGFDDGGVDPTTATFDASYITYPGDVLPFKFYYTTQYPNLTGYAQLRCPACFADHATVTITPYVLSSDCCCDGKTLCSEVDIPDGSDVYSFLLSVGSVSNATTMMNFTYTLPGENAALEEDLNQYLATYGGGTATVTAGVGVSTISITAACREFTRACLDGACTSYINFTTGTCL